MELSSSDLAAILESEQALAKALESADPMDWVGFYTEDAVFVGPRAPALEGRAAFLAAAPRIDMKSVELVAESTVGDGEFAARLGRAAWLSASAQVRRRFLMVWRHEADGQWRIVREMLTDDV
jgi:ketosteroid isomerase-like protein